MGNITRHLPLPLKAGLKRAIWEVGSHLLESRPFQAASNFGFNELGPSFRDVYVRLLGDTPIRQSFVWRDPHDGREVLMPVQAGYQPSWSATLSCLWSEPGVRRLLDRYVALRPAPGMFFDVGANHGYRSYPLLAAGYTCVVFEPQARCTAYIRATCELNHFHPIIEQQVLGSTEGEVDFYEADVSWFSSVRPVDGVTARRVTVKSEPLDAYVARTGRRASVMKIDVEGHELAVLRGARGFLAQDRPLVVVEVWRSSPEKRDIYDFFVELGYAVRAVSDTTLSAPLTAEEFMTSAATDFMACCDAELGTALATNA